MACADEASGARTRSLTVVSVSSAIRRRRGSDGEVAPRSQRETVIASTPSSSASCFWVSPAPRRAARRRPPTPSVLPAPTLRGFYHTRRTPPCARHLRSSRTRLPHRSQRWYRSVRKNGRFRRGRRCPRIRHRSFTLECRRGRASSRCCRRWRRPTNALGRVLDSLDHRLAVPEAPVVHPLRRLRRGTRGKRS